ncbi:hypothetical protein Rrhod_2751 [Rhodococcus rhodnii LMG 5362]|uniref:Uncharacterized protein n=1 Tax=Rhodococcus rhodnii LMG 5362 TaxID=1273125 RepID=R7WKP3_9NOCA|nr:hypothetical protein Rrhod_2751 [Rhodococcus rhodnii LMG 5362]
MVAAIATSSIAAGSSCGLRRSSSRIVLTTRSSARVPAYMPFGPALPNGVRMPSTNTTLRWVGEATRFLLVELDRIPDHGHGCPASWPQFTRVTRG